MSIKYVVVPGLVDSEDGDTHWISASRLMRLYGVNPNECVALTPGVELPRIDPRLVRLRPDPTGKYRVPQ